MEESGDVPSLVSQDGEQTLLVARHGVGNPVVEFGVQVEIGLDDVPRSIRLSLVLDVREGGSVRRQPPSRPPLRNPLDGIEVVAANRRGRSCARRSKAKHAATRIRPRVESLSNSAREVVVGQAGGYLDVHYVVHGV